MIVDYDDACVYVVVVVAVNYVSRCMSVLLLAYVCMLTAFLVVALGE